MQAGAPNILISSRYLPKPSCFTFAIPLNSPCSTLQSCCLIHHHMQRVVCKYPVISLALPFHVPVCMLVTVVIVPQMLWAAASSVPTDMLRCMTAVLTAVCTGLSSIGWASECAVSCRSFGAYNVTQFFWSALLRSGLPAATSGCVKRHCLKTSSLPTCINRPREADQWCMDPVPGSFTPGPAWLATSTWPRQSTDQTWSAT